MSNAKFDCGIKRMRTRAAAARMVLLTSTALCLSLAAPAPVLAQDDAETANREQGKEFNIPPSDMGKALDAYAEQADVEIIYSDRDVAGKLSNGVHGTYARDTALDELIGNSGLNYTINEDGVVVIQAASLEVKEAAAERPLMRVGALETEQAEETESDEVIVTGTNIRGLAETPSPTETINRQSITDRGYSSLPELFRDVTSNLNNISPTGSFSAVTDATQENTQYYATGVNLRGLGTESTLTLLNGMRRPSVAGSRVVDVSAIPLAAIERVEISTGGKSSIYGADAVAGVVNIITRRSFDGAETSAQYSARDGATGDNYRISQVLGKQFDRGGVVAAYELQNADALDATAAGVAYPSGSGDIAVPGAYLLSPGRRQHAGFFSGEIEVGESLTLFADSLYTSTDLQTIVDTRGAFNLRSASDILTVQYSLSGGVEIDIINDWQISIVGLFGEASNRFRFQQEYSGPFSFMAADDQREVFHIASVSSIADGTVMDINGRSVKGAFGFEYREEDFSYHNMDLDPASAAIVGSDEAEFGRNVTSLFGEVVLPVIEGSNAAFVKEFSVFLSGRRDEYSDFGSTFNPQIGAILSTRGGMKIRGGFSTAFRPPVLPDLAVELNAIGIEYASNSEVSSSPTPIFVVRGTKAGLEPEKAKTWTLGLDYAPPFAGWLSLSVDYFQVDYKNRIVSPFFGVTNVSAFSKQLDAFRELYNFNPTQAEFDAIFAADPGPVRVFGGSSSLFDPASGDIFATFPEIVLSDQRKANLASERVKGLDFRVAVNFETNNGAVFASFSGTHIFEKTRKVTNGAPAFDYLNDFGQPVDTKLQGSLGWRRRTIGVIGAVHYVDSYTDSFTTQPTPVDSFTTFDLVAKYDGSQLSDARILKTLEANFRVSNLFDVKPPLVPASNRFVPISFDGANASPFGRVFSISVTKRW